MTSKPQILIPFDNQKLATRVLSDFLSIGCQLYVKIYASLGTCLGFYRDRNFIPGDNDIDVFIVCTPNIRNIFFNNLSQSGFQIDTIPGASPSMNSHVFKQGIFIDVWFKQRPSYMRYYRGNLLFPLSNISIFQPDQIESYLTTVYGNWKTVSANRANCFGN